MSVNSSRFITSYKSLEVTYTVMNNAEFARLDQVFRVACELADTKPTKRQASKFRNNKGRTSLLVNQAKRKILEDKKEGE